LRRARGAGSAVGQEVVLAPADAAHAEGKSTGQQNAVPVSRAAPPCRLYSQNDISQKVRGKALRCAAGMHPCQSQEDWPPAVESGSSVSGPLPFILTRNRAKCSNSGLGIEFKGSACPISGLPRPHRIQSTAQLKRLPPPRPSPLAMGPIDAQIYLLPPTPKFLPGPRPVIILPSPNFTLSTKGASILYVCAWWGMWQKPKI